MVNKYKSSIPWDIFFHTAELFSQKLEKQWVCWSHKMGSWNAGNKKFHWENSLKNNTDVLSFFPFHFLIEVIQWLSLISKNIPTLIYISYVSVKKFFMPSSFFTSCNIINLIPIILLSSITLCRCKFNRSEEWPLSVPYSQLLNSQCVY